MFFLVHPGQKRLLQMVMPKMDMPIHRVGRTVILNLMVTMKMPYLVLVKSGNGRNDLQMMKITE